MSTSVAVIITVLVVVTIYAVLEYISESRHQAQRNMLIDSESTINIPKHIHTEAVTAARASARVKLSKRQARQRKAQQ